MLPDKVIRKQSLKVVAFFQSPDALKLSRMLGNYLPEKNKLTPVLSNASYGNNVLPWKKTIIIRYRMVESGKLVCENLWPMLLRWVTMLNWQTDWKKLVRMQIITPFASQDDFKYKLGLKSIYKRQLIQSWRDYALSACLFLKDMLGQGDRQFSTTITTTITANLT